MVAGMSGWLGKLWADRYLANEKSKWELELAHYRASAERSLATTKAELELQAKNSHLKFSRLHEERLKVLAECYRLLSDVFLDCTRCIEPDLFGRKKPIEADLLLAALGSYDAFRRYFELNKLYFSVPIERQLQSFVFAAAKSLDEYRVYVGRIGSTGWTAADYNELALKWHTSLFADLKSSREVVSNAFRSVLEA